MSLDKIAKLLRQAERAGTPEEAETFFAKAQELATRESIDLAIARQHSASKEKASAPVIENIMIGEPRTKGLRTYCVLFTEIGEANNVKFLLAANSTSVIAHGFPEDIAVTKEIYNTVLPQMIKQSDAYVRSDERKAQRVVDENKWWEGSKPLHGSTARLNFQLAYAYRIGRRLRRARQEAIRSALRENSGADPTLHDGETSTALAIRNTEVAVEEFFAARTRHIRGHWRGGRAGGKVSEHATSAGRNAAEKARLGTERAIAATSHNRGQL